MESREAIDIDFSRYLLVLKRRWLPAISIFWGTVAVAILATTLSKPSYEAEGQLIFKLPSFKVVGEKVLPNSNEGQETADLSSLISTQNPITTQIEVISSPPILQRTIDELQLKDLKGEPLKVEEMAKALKMKIVGGTDVLQITYQSKDPQVAAAVVNKVMSIYIEDNIRKNQLEAKKIISIISQELPKTKADFLAAQAAIRRFKQQNNIVDLSEEAKSSVSNLTNLDNQLADVRGEFEQVSAQTNQLRQKVGLSEQEAIAVSAISQSQAVQEVLKQLQDLDKQLATERSRFSEEAPVIVSLQTKKANLQSLLQQEIQKTLGSKTQVPQGILQVGSLRQNLIEEFLRSEVQRQGLANKLASLYNSRSRYAQRGKIIPQLFQNQVLLEQQAEATKSSYQNLIKKLQELQLAPDINTSNAKILAQAIVPKKPIGGKKIIVVAIGVMLGAFLSTTIVLLLEMRDRSLKTIQEVTAIFPYTLLGIIPLFGKYTRSRNQETEAIDQSIIVIHAPECLTSEIYRMIQANMKFLSSDTRIKSIVITSSVPQEGKSTVAANLGAAIAQLGRKVLLIDADMRLPSQHHFWQLTNEFGLSEVLVGQAEFNTAVSKVIDNLDVLPAGVRPPNPLALLDSKRMAALIDELSYQYDFIIIDTPPLLLAADALTLSQMTDGMLLVARPGVIDANAAKASKEMLARSDQNVLGMVINGIIEQNEPSSYFYHAKTYFSESNRVAKAGKMQSKIFDKKA